jgi:hypothetical protein
MYIYTYLYNSVMDVTIENIKTVPAVNYIIDSVGKREYCIH